MPVRPYHASHAGRAARDSIVARPLLPSLEALRIFAAAADAKYQSAAAKRLGISSSAVSQATAKLEADLGAELFIRGSRPMKLTKAGERLLEAAKPLLAAAEALPALVAPQSATGIRLRLGLGESAGATIGPWLIAKLFEHAEDLETSSGLTGHLIDRLREDALDVVISPEPMLEDPRWARELLYEEDFLFVAAKTVPLPRTAAEAKTLSAGRPFIGYAGGSSDEVEIERILRSMNAAPQKTVRVSSSYTLCGLVAATGGWSILPPTNLWCARQFLGLLNFGPLPEGMRRMRRMWAAADPLMNAEALALTAAAAREVFAAEMVPELRHAAPGLEAYVRQNG